MSAVAAILSMVWIDLTRPFYVARLRARALHGFGTVRSIAGLLPSQDEHLEAAIQSLRRRSALAKRIAFLGKTQQIFHLWHVVHRPFSYSFAVLAVLHLVVVFALGYL
jgi:hypothetical protein